MTAKKKTTVHEDKNKYVILDGDQYLVDADDFLSSNESGSLFGPEGAKEILGLLFDEDGDMSSIKLYKLVEVPYTISKAKTTVKIG